jgi:hypothetical protein
METKTRANAMMLKSNINVTGATKNIASPQGFVIQQY